MSYVIEENVQIPPMKRGGRPMSEERKLMQTMAVGQSFLIADYDRWMFVRSFISKMTPRKFIMRKSPGGWRLWRVE